MDAQLARLNFNYEIAQRQCIAHSLSVCVCVCVNERDLQCCDMLWQDIHKHTYLYITIR